MPGAWDDSQCTRAAVEDAGHLKTAFWDIRVFGQWKELKKAAGSILAQD
jgi:hypothetical protein